MNSLIKVRVRNDIIYITDAGHNKNVTVYDINGDTETSSLKPPAIYTVDIERKRYKVAL